jgi:MoxR-like ATPase
LKKRGQLLEVIQASQQKIIGQKYLIEGLLAALIGEGHALIEGPPGLGKTLSAKVLAGLCELSYARVQFTPDLLPSDIVGTLIFNPATSIFETKKGPLFAQIVLADEINRAPAKTQSALLEAMEERQVTLGDTSHALPRPFIVMATQNPLEQEGTYPLPEAQIDRFMLKIKVSYPSFENEKSILDFQGQGSDPAQFQIAKLMGASDLAELKNEVTQIFIDPLLKDKIVTLVRATRPTDSLFPSHLKGAFTMGASPRSLHWLAFFSQFQAYLQGRDHILPEDIIFAAPYILAHRILLSYEAKVDGINAEEAITRLAMQLVN